jgi:hypothetical protein
MSDSYLELQTIWAGFFEGDRSNTSDKCLKVLNTLEILTRQKDGELKQLTLSKPTSVEKALAMGLRYRKENGTCAEDVFVFQEGRPVERFYRGKLEREMPEYKGTHHRQIMSTLLDDAPLPITSVNTITMTCA